jgi:hypothetical protein
VKKGRMSSAVVASVAPAPHGLIPRVACIIMIVSDYLCACVVCACVRPWGSLGWLAGGRVMGSHRQRWSIRRRWQPCRAAVVCRG